MPAYVALALVSMRRALGDRFLLLTSRSVSEHIDADIMNKAWAFEPLSFTLANGIEAIVAKSDFIRMAFVHRWGGAWLDADTLLFRDPSVELFPTGRSHKLHWHSECIFASLPGNPILAQALAIGLESENHAGVILGESKITLPRLPMLRHPDWRGGHRSRISSALQLCWLRGDASHRYCRRGIFD